MVSTLTSIYFNNPGQQFKIETGHMKMQSVDTEICLFLRKGLERASLRQSLHIFLIKLFLVLHFTD